VCHALRRAALRQTRKNGPQVLRNLRARAAAPQTCSLATAAQRTENGV
jgi:hypothetical protein